MSLGGPELEIETVFENLSQTPQLLSPDLICDNKGKSRRSLFQILDKSGKRLKYKGKLVKRAPYTKSEYIELRPGEKISSKCRLDKSYQISQEILPASIKFTAYNSQPNSGPILIESKAIKLKSFNHNNS